MIWHAQGSLLADIEEKSIIRIFEAVNQDIPDSGSLPNFVFYSLLTVIAGANVEVKLKRAFDAVR
jgi:hypothetical protein